MQGDGWEARLKNRCVWVGGTEKERVRESEDERDGESKKGTETEKRKRKVETHHMLGLLLCSRLLL